MVMGGYSGRGLELAHLLKNENVLFVQLVIFESIINKFDSSVKNESAKTRKILF